MEINNRIVYFSDFINSESTEKLVSFIIKINEEDLEMESKIVGYNRSPICIHIDSYGGEVYRCMSIIFAIRNSTTPVYTYCLGISASCGFLIFLAGHKRIISKYGTLMYHTILCGCRGSLQSLIENVEETERMQVIVNEFVCKHTKIKISKLKEIQEMKKDWYMGAEEALKLKCADEIMEVF